MANVFKKSSACEYCGKFMESAYRNKRFCSDKCRVYAKREQNKAGVVVQDLTKSNVAIEPPEQATSNYAINSDGNEKSRKEQILAEIEAIKKEEKPSFVAKTDFERNQKKRLAKLEAELQSELYRTTQMH